MSDLALTTTTLALEASQHRMGWGHPARLFGITPSFTWVQVDEGDPYDIVGLFTLLPGEDFVAVALVVEGWAAPPDGPVPAAIPAGNGPDRGGGRPRRRLRRRRPSARRRARGDAARRHGRADGGAPAGLAAGDGGRELSDRPPSGGVVRGVVLGQDVAAEVAVRVAPDGVRVVDAPLRVVVLDQRGRGPCTR